MGINRFSWLLKKFPNVVKSVPLDTFKGKRIAIDGNGWSYANLHSKRKDIINRTNIVKEDPSTVAIRKSLTFALFAFVFKLIDRGICPVVIFDGTPPAEKLAVREKRTDKRAEARALVAALRAQADAYPDQISIPKKLVDDLRKAMINALELGTGDYREMKLILRAARIPCIQATGEAEQLCAVLCREGHVAAAWTRDSDALVYGARCVITRNASADYDLDSDMVIPMVTCVMLDDLLNEAGLEFETFVDICIMSGCDYNQNISGLGIGKLYDRLKPNKRIEDLVLKTSQLAELAGTNYQRCRELFMYVPSTSLVIERDGICDWCEEWRGDALHPGPVATGPPDGTTVPSSEEVIIPPFTLIDVRPAFHPDVRSIVESYGVGYIFHKLVEALGRFKTPLSDSPYEPKRKVASPRFVMKPRVVI